MKRVFISLFLTISVLFMPQMASAQNESIVRFEKFLQEYYQAPDADQVPRYLMEVIGSEFFMTGEVFRQNRQLLYAYAFGRMAELEPSLIPLYMKIFDTAPLEGRLFMVNVFQVCGGDAVRKYLQDSMNDPAFEKVKPLIEAALSQEFPLAYDPFVKEINIPYDIEMLWVEYFLTGNSKAIERIVSVLGREDMIRDKVKAYFASDASQEDKALLAERVTKVLAVDVDPTTYEFNSIADFGSILMGRARSRSITVDDFEEFLDQVEISNEEFIRVSTKAEALRSLEAYARRDELVLEAVEDQVMKIDGSSKDALLNIAFRGEFRRGNNEKARDYLLELITRVPEQPLLHAVLAEIYLAMNDIAAATNQVDFISRRDPQIANNLRRIVEKRRVGAWGEQADADGEPVADLSLLVSTVKAKVKNIQSYQTNAIIGDRQAPVIAWDADYEAPNTYAVEQALFRQDGVLVNRWMIVDNEILRFMGAWVIDKENDSGFQDLSDNLRMVKWANILPAGDSIRSARISVDEEELIRLTFSVDKSTGFFRQPLSDDIRGRTIQMWVDADSKLIRRGLLTVDTVNDNGDPLSVIYEQMFFSFNSDLPIERPEQVLEEMPEVETPAEVETEAETAEVEAE